MKVYDFDSYKDYVKARVAQLPKNGRGEYHRIAKALGMHTTLVSQIFKGERDLSFEQACAFCEYWGLRELETDYFLKLLLLNRAGTERTRRVLKRQLDDLRTKAHEVASRLPQKAKSMSESDQAIYYSSWVYQAARLVTSIEGLQSVDGIAQRLGIGAALAGRVVECLLATGLCEEKNDRIIRSTQNTHISARSPLVARHHANWRLKAMAHHDQMDPLDLAFTAPVALARQDLAKVRAILLRAIEDITKLIDNSPSEELAALTIDWFRIKPLQPS